MALFHYLQYRAFAHETEDPARVKQALVHAAHTDKLTLEETTVEGSHKNRIVILEAQARASNAAKAMFRDLQRDDPEGFARVVEEVPRRLDEHVNFFLRLDKQAAYLGKTRLAHDEDAILVRGKLRVFAPKRAQTDDHALVTQLQEYFHQLR